MIYRPAQASSADDVICCQRRFDPQKKRQKSRQVYIQTNLNIHLNQYWANKNKSVLTGEEEEEEEGANL